MTNKIFQEKIKTIAPGNDLQGTLYWNRDSDEFYIIVQFCLDKSEIIPPRDKMLYMFVSLSDGNRYMEPATIDKFIIPFNMERVKPGGRVTIEVAES